MLALTQHQLQNPLFEAGIPRYVSTWKLTLPWLLLIPFLFLAVHGHFSFFNANSNSDLGEMAGYLMQDDRDSGPLVKALQVVTYLLIFALVTTKHQSIVQAAKTFKLPTALAILAVASCLWSQAPAISIRAACLYLADTAFAYYLINELEPRRQMGLLTIIGIAGAAASLVIIVAFPQFGLVNSSEHLGSWQGIFVGKNVSAMFFAFMLTPAVSFRRGAMNWRRWAYVALMLVFIAMSKSRTAWAVTFTYLVVMFLLSFLGRFSRRSALLLAACGALILALGAMTLFDYLPALLHALGRDETLSGRTAIWNALLLSISKSPILGYGLRGFWLPDTGESMNVALSTGWVFAYAHNGFLEIALQLGLLGLVTAVLCLSQAVRNAARLHLAPTRPACLDFYTGIIVLTILYNIDEGTMLYPGMLVSILFVMACAGLIKLNKEISIYSRSHVR